MLWMLSAVFGGFALAEVVSLLLATATIRFLRRHATAFSPQTYRLHLQLIVVLIVQVRMDSVQSVRFSASISSSSNRWC